MPKYKWSISIYHGNSPFDLHPCGPDESTITSAIVEDMKCVTVADPFLLRRNGRWYLFFEALNAATGLGEIAHAVSDDLKTWVYAGVVLREPHHLSYPQVFEHAGTVYMVPETRQANAIQLYAARSFPQEWEKVSLLRTGNFADPTLMRHEGRWWMFAQRGLDETRVLYSDSLESGWAEHVGNPFWAGKRKYCRPGGRVVSYEGSNYRFVQDTLVRYGASVRVLRIKRLDEEQIEEEEIAKSPVLTGTFRGWNALGMHHVDAIELEPGRWVAAVDGVTYRGG